MTQYPPPPYGNDPNSPSRAPRPTREPAPWETVRRTDQSAPTPAPIPLKPVDEPGRGQPAISRPNDTGRSQPARTPASHPPPHPSPSENAREPKRESGDPASGAGASISLAELDRAISDVSAPTAVRTEQGASIDSAEASRIATMSPRHKFEAWLAVMMKTGASDLILRAGGRPSTRIDGRIGFLPGRVPAAGALLEVLEGVMGKDRMEMWRATGSADAALQLDGLGRYRINAYKQMGEPAVVMRRISENAPVLASLELPVTDLVKIAMRKRGLVLVTGIAGSGKSTTLAAMIQHLNENAERHVITLEDPIEVLFSEQRCVISQREIGIDCGSFHEGLRHALRQSPDVILIGEMRDRETVSAALDAAETGHMVMSTLHTVNAAQTLDRILGFFPAEQHVQVRTRLSDNLAGVLSQRLIPRSSGKGMVPAFELLTQTPRVRELIEKGETGELMRTIEQGATPGLISFNQSLKRLVTSKLVELKDALAASDRPEELVLSLRGITSSSGRRGGEGSAPAPN